MEINEGEIDGVKWNVNVVPSLFNLWRILTCWGLPPPPATPARKMSARPLRRPLLAQSDARSRSSETIYSQKGIPAAMRTFACLLRDYSQEELSDRGRKTKLYLYTFTVTFVLKRCVKDAQ